MANFYVRSLNTYLMVKEMYYGAYNNPTKLYLFSSFILFSLSTTYVFQALMTRNGEKMREEKSTKNIRKHTEQRLFFNS